MNHDNRLTQNQCNDLLTVLRQLCRLFWGPSAQLSRDMLDDSFLNPFASFAALFRTNVDDELAELGAIVNGFSGPEALSAYLEEGYVRLFVNTRGGVATPLYASCYEDEENPQLMGKAALRMQKMMTVLDIHIGGDIGEPPDHLAIQLEILYFLLTLKDAPDHPEGLVPAADFAATEMLPWVRAFHRRLADESHCRFYPLIAGVLLAVLQAIGTLPKPLRLLRSQ